MLTRPCLVVACLVISHQVAQAQQPQTAAQRDELDRALGRAFGTGGGSRRIAPMGTQPAPGNGNDPRSGGLAGGDAPMVDASRSFGVPTGSRIQPTFAERPTSPAGPARSRSRSASSQGEYVPPSFTDEEVAAIYRDWLELGTQAQAAAQKVAPERRAKVIESASRKATTDLARKHKFDPRHMAYIVEHGPDVVDQAEPVPSRPATVATPAAKPAAPAVKPVAEPRGDGLPVRSKTEAQHRAIYKEWSASRATAAAAVAAAAGTDEQKAALLRNTEIKLSQDLAYKHQLSRSDVDLIGAYGARKGW